MSAVGFQVMAGAMKAQYGYPLPDMLQAAVAMQAPNPAIITNDKLFMKINELDVFFMEDFIKPNH